MRNAYLVVVEYQINNALTSMFDLHRCFEEFLGEANYIDGMNGDNPSPLIKNALKGLDEAIYQKQLVKDFIEEVQHG